MNALARCKKCKLHKLKETGIWVQYAGRYSKFLCKDCASTHTNKRGRKPGGTNKPPPPGPPLPAPQSAPRPTAWTLKSDYKNVLELWFSVLRLAVADLGARSADDRQRAKLWILDVKYRGPQSCYWVCDALGISHEAFLSACLSREGRARILMESDNRGQPSSRTRPVKRTGKAATVTP